MLLPFKLLSQEEINFLVHNDCCFPFMHFPEDLCHWTSQISEDGSPETLYYQDDGFGNLIRIFRDSHLQILMFRFSGKTH